MVLLIGGNISLFQTLRFVYSNVANFLVLGLEVSENGILLCKDFNGRPSGEAYVQFSGGEETEKAIEKNNANMGHRWGVGY